MKFILKILYITILVSLTSSAFCQDLSKKTKDELKEMKSEAVANEDFQLAQKIKKEIENRKTALEFKQEYETELSAALQKEQYGKAAQIKERIKLCSKIIKTDSLLQIAIDKEDYQQAQKLKDEKEKGLEVLRSPLSTDNSEIAKTSNDKSSSDQKHETQKSKKEVGKKDKIELIFRLRPIRKNILKFLDIYIDEKYVGSIDENSQLTLTNIKKGNHQFIYNDIEFEINESAVIEVLGLVKTKLIEKNRIEIDENTVHKKINSKLSLVFRVLPYSNEKEHQELSQEQDFNDIKFPLHDSPFKAKYNITSISTDIPSYFNSIVNWGFNYTTPINRNLGLVSGLGYQITIFENIYNGSTVRDMYSSWFGSFGYRFEFSPGILLRPDLELGFSLLATNSGNEVGLHSQLNLGVGFLFGKAKKYGLLLEPSYKLGAGPGFSIGFIFSNIKYPEKRHLQIE